MKKRMVVVLAVISFLFFIYLTCFLGNSVSLSAILVDEEQFGAIIEKRQESDEFLLRALFFDGQQLSYDKLTNTFYYSMAEDMGSAYDPHVEKTTSCGQEISIAVLGMQISEDSLRMSKRYRMVAYSNIEYREYSIVCTTLPLMNLECDGDICDEKLPVRMTLFDNRRGAVTRFIESEGRISIRGRSSRSYPKKGFRLSLTQESLAGNVRQNRVSLLGMRQDDDWILYAAYNDPEKVRNVFSSNLWKHSCAGDNALGIDNGMEYRYLELFINDQYWGLYALGYPIDERQMEIDMSAGERLYKKGTWDTEDRILSCQEKPVDGYETSEGGEGIWEPLKMYYDTLYSQWDNPQELYAGIDIDNAVDFYLFLNLIQGIDHVGALNSLSIKNMFLSFHDRDGKKTVIYTPWDMDVTWGQQWTGNMEENMVRPYGIKSSQNTVMELGNLPALTMSGDDNIWKKIFDKYEKLRQGAWAEETINQMLDELEADIYLSGAYIRDRERWQDGSYMEAEKGLGNFRQYVMNRLQETDAYYMRLKKLVLDDGIKNAYILRSLQYKDFLECDFVLLTGGMSFPVDAERQEFLEYIGVDMQRLADGADVVVISGSKNRAEYYDMCDLTRGINTCIGFLSVQGDAQTGNCVLKTGEEIWCGLDENPVLNLMFCDGDRVSLFDFTREYVMWSRAVEEGNVQVWRSELEKHDYDVIIEIVNHDVVEEKCFRVLLETFGVNPDKVSADVDFIAIKDMGDEVTILENSHGSGDRRDTVFGELRVFYNDAGGYGVYLNGNECMLVQSGDNDDVDIRVAVIADSPYEVIWCPVFQY